MIRGRYAYRRVTLFLCHAGGQLTRRCPALDSGVCSLEAKRRLAPEECVDELHVSSTAASFTCYRVSGCFRLYQAWAEINIRELYNVTSYDQRLLHFARPRSFFDIRMRRVKYRRNQDRRILKADTLDIDNISARTRLSLSENAAVAEI